MGDSEKRRRDRKREFQRKVRQRLTRNQKILLLLFDVVMIAMLLTDIAYFLGILRELNLMHLAVLNVAVVAVGYVSYKTKRIIGRRVVREMFRTREDEATETNRIRSEEGISREGQGTEK